MSPPIGRNACWYIEELHRKSHTSYSKHYAPSIVLLEGMIFSVVNQIISKQRFSKNSGLLAAKKEELTKEVHSDGRNIV